MGVFFFFLIIILLPVFPSRTVIGSEKNVLYTDTKWKHNFLNTYSANLTILDKLFNSSSLSLLICRMRSTIVPSPWDCNESWSDNPPKVQGQCRVSDVYICMCVCVSVRVLVCSYIVNRQSVPTMIWLLLSPQLKFSKLCVTNHYYHHPHFMDETTETSKD